MKKTSTAEKLEVSNLLSRSRRILENAALSDRGDGRKEIALCVTSGEREYSSLWQFVILQALIDAQCGSPKPELKRARAEAIAWFSQDNEDFREVCAMAGMCVKKTLAGAAEAIRESKKNMLKDSHIRRRKNQKNNTETIYKCEKRTSLLPKKNVSLPTTHYVESRA